VAVQVAPVDKTDPHVFPCTREGSPLIGDSGDADRGAAGVSDGNILTGAIADSVAGEIKRCRGQAEVARRVPVPARVTACDVPQFARVIIEGQQPSRRTGDRRSKGYTGGTACSRN